MTATKTRKTRRELTPADVTARFPSFNGRRLENWAAKSRDGVWKYERIEDVGTLWTVIYVPTGTEGAYYGTLTAARQATADGSALADINLRLAHGRGEHKAERVPACGRC